MISAWPFCHFRILISKSVYLFHKDLLAVRDQRVSAMYYGYHAYTQTHTPHGGIAEGYVEHNLIAALFFHYEVMALSEMGDFLKQTFTAEWNTWLSSINIKSIQPLHSARAMSFL